MAQQTPLSGTSIYYQRNINPVEICEWAAPIKGNSQDLLVKPKQMAQCPTFNESNQDKDADHVDEEEEDWAFRLDVPEADAVQFL